MRDQLLAKSIYRQAEEAHVKVMRLELLIFLGISASIIVSVFLVSLTRFALRTHGPMGQIRLEQILSSFPWWAPVIALIGLFSGIYLLKKYDFSYRKNFGLFIHKF